MRERARACLRREGRPRRAGPGADAARRSRRGLGRALRGVSGRWGMTGGSARSVGARASAVRASAPTGGPGMRGVARGLREGAVRVGLGRAPCGSEGACASWATRGVNGLTLRAGWSRPGGEGKRRVGHGPLRVGLGCELGFLFWVWVPVWLKADFFFGFFFLFPILLLSKSNSNKV